ncbi:MAG: bifunctional precorrin-2 dehydrogenase/sirohydrochlorin ferrochelatase, partial [Pseudomonadota bacterium]
VERAGGEVIDDIARAVDEGVRIAFVAYEDARACEAAAINLRCAGMLVNVVDRPELCDFTTPSILDRDPLLIAIGTGGASAGLAKHVRLRLERILPPTLGKLADAMKALRPRLREQFPDGAERRRAIDDALREGGALDALDPKSHERAQDWAKGARAESHTAWHEFTITSGDPDDLTIKQARLLGEADCVCIDGPVPTAIRARARADAQRVSCDGQACALAREGSDITDAMPACAASSGDQDGNRLTVILRWRPGD